MSQGQEADYQGDLCPVELLVANNSIGDHEDEAHYDELAYGEGDSEWVKHGSLLSRGSSRGLGPSISFGVNLLQAE